MAVELANVRPGAYKAQAMADALQQLYGDSDIWHINRYIDDQQAKMAVKECDLLISTVDDDTARLAVSLLSTLYQLPLLDIAVGVSFQPAAQSAVSRRELGADLRLILPGDGCLLCRSGLGDFAGAVENLSRTSLSQHRQAQDQRGWRSVEHMGSSLLWNTQAVSEGVELLWQLARGEISRSTWLRLQKFSGGNLHTVTIDGPPTSNLIACPYCQRAGAGDGALFWR